MEKIYKIKDEADIDSFGELKYEMIDASEGAGTVPDYKIIKTVPQDIKSELPQLIINGVYSNPEWIKKFYVNNKETFRKVLGLSYGINGKIKMSKKFKAICEGWRITIDPFGDKWLGFESIDPFDQRVFYNASILDKYCGEEIKTLLDKGLIEIIEVEG